MKMGRKRAFTVIELVIVIAVIAVLAAVLIPTFSSIIKQANDATAKNQLRDIQIKLEIELSKENKYAYTDQYGGETVIHRNTDGRLWAEYNGEQIPLSTALNICPILYEYGSFAEQDQDLIYTIKNGGAKIIWYGIVGERPDIQNNPPEIVEPIYPEKDAEASEGLEFVYIQSSDEYHVSGIGDCTDTEIIIPKYYKGKLVCGIGAYAFEHNQNITSVTIPETVGVIGVGAFSYCQSLGSVTMPESVNKLTLGPGAFSNCINLESINLPDGITKICGRIFYDCRSLKEVNIPKSVIEIEASAFEQCRSITSIVIPEGVEKIELQTFILCSSLEELTIPASVIYIREFAFAHCNNLKSVNYGGTIAEWNKVRKDDYAFTAKFDVTCSDGTTPYISITPK